MRQICHGSIFSRVKRQGAMHEQMTLGWEEEA